MCILFACCTLEVSILLHLMKTYLLDILNKYNRFSEKLDVKTILCNKAWLVFNDEGKKELFIFQEDGSLIASVNGNVTYANWQYIPANKSVIISYDKERFMLHPAFIDNIIFALQQDGTERFAFMIEEKQSQCFNPKTLKELNAYFESIMQKEIEAKEQARLKQIERQRVEEEQRIQQERIREEQERQAEIARRKEEQRLAQIAKEEKILKQYKSFTFFKVIGKILVISIGILLVFGPFIFYIYIPFWLVLALPIFMPLIAIFIIIPFLSTFFNRLKEKMRTKLLHKYYQEQKEIKRKKQEEEEAIRRKKKEEIIKRQKEEEAIRRKEMEEARKRQKKEEEEAIRRMKERQAEEEHEEERKRRAKEMEEQLAKQKLNNEKTEILTEKALDIEKQINQGRKSKELARQVSLKGEYIGVASDTQNYTFKISWMCPNFTYKEVSLIINNGEDVLLYEHLYVTGSQTIELKEVKSEIRVTLRLGLYDVYAYRIVLIEMDKQLNEFTISRH